jgi:hypothetical protein
MIAAPHIEPSRCRSLESKMQFGLPGLRQFQMIKTEHRQRQQHENRTERRNDPGLLESGLQIAAEQRRQNPEQRISQCRGDDIAER